MIMDHDQPTVGHLAQGDANTTARRPRDAGACSPRRPRGLDPDRPLAVWRLAERLREVIAGVVRPVWIVGEIVGPRTTRGTLRFTLRDDRGQVECVRWATDSAVDSAPVVAGSRASVLVTPTVFARSLSIACVVSDIRQSSEAERKRRRDRLREQLTREGLFAEGRKRPLPSVPQRVGVITSPGSAAWHDLVAIARARHPGIPLVLVPAQMQGDGAADSIVVAVEGATASSLFDVLVLTRGGGSASDLEVFDDERVARAIVASRVPVVAAIGHETDCTMADAAADARAATPSAAAVLVIPARDQLDARLRQLTARMAGALEERITRQAERHRTLSDAVARSVLFRMNGAHRDVHRLWAHLDHVGVRRGPAEVERVHALQAALKAGLTRQVAQARARQETLAAQVTALDPQAVLARGYAIARGISGAALSATADFRPGQVVDLQLADGCVKLVVWNPDSPSPEEVRV